VRVIGGTLKGRKFFPPKNTKTRPTTDFAREALFNVLTSTKDINDAVVIDFFAGMGGITYEFVSRGATEVIACDVSAESRSFVMKHCLEYGITDRVKFVKGDFFKLVKVFNIKADFIFVDPPFTSKKYPEIVAAILQQNILKEDGLLIVEHQKEVIFSDLPGFSETRPYGKVNFSFFNALV